MKHNSFVDYCCENSDKNGRYFSSLAELKCIIYLFEVLPDIFSHFAIVFVLNKMIVEKKRYATNIIEPQSLHRLISIFVICHLEVPKTKKN